MSDDEGWRDSGPSMRGLLKLGSPGWGDVLEAFLEEGAYVTGHRLRRWIERYPQFRIPLLRLGIELIHVLPPRPLTPEEEAQGLRIANEALGRAGLAPLPPPRGLRRGRTRRRSVRPRVRPSTPS